MTPRFLHYANNKTYRQKGYSTIDPRGLLWRIHRENSERVRVRYARLTKYVILGRRRLV
jgi:hypothetical protein